MIVEHTVATPPWVKALVDDLLGVVTPLGFIGPLGYSYAEPTDEADAWEVLVYPTPNVVAGPDKHDGGLFVSGFQLDVGRVIAMFCAVDEVVWNSPAKYTGALDGPEVSVLGRYTTKRVRLRFFHLPPPGEEPAFKVDPRTGVATELPA